MKKIQNIAPRTLLGLELILAVCIPFIIWWSLTPTNVLYSSFLFGLLACVGLSGSVIIFFAGIPMGIVGVKKAKELGKQRIPMIVLSLVNLTAGIIEVGMLISFFYMVAFRGVSV